MQSGGGVPQQGGGGGTCLELGNYGMEEELEKLKRDRNTLMAEIMKLKQLQRSSKGRITAMEERIHGTERKQQQIMSFLAKAFRSPMFVQQYVQQKNIDEKHIEIGQKRRLTMSATVENELQQAVNGTQLSNYFTGEDQEEFGDIDLKVESLFSDETSIGEKVPPSGVANIWEEFLSDDLVVGDEAEQVLGGDDVEVEELVAKTPEWGEHLQDLVDQLGFL